MRLRHIALLVSLLSGCYIYRPVGSVSPPNGHLVRLTLTDAGTANLAAELGPSVVAVDGRLMNDSGDAFLLSVTDSRKRNGIEMGWQGEQISVSKSLVATVHERKFSRTRTVFVSAGLIAAIFVAREAFWGPGGVFGGDKPGPGPGPR